MPSPDVHCSVCDAQLELAGDERPGDSVLCMFCGAHFLFQRPRRSESEDAFELEEDF